MDDDDGCRWFLRCTNEATLYIEHPTMGKVAVCARCFGIFTQQEGETYDGYRDESIS